MGAELIALTFAAGAAAAGAGTAAAVVGTTVAGITIGVTGAAVAGALVGSAVSIGGALIQRQLGDTSVPSPSASFTLVDSAPWRANVFGYTRNPGIKLFHGVSWDDPTTRGYYRIIALANHQIDAGEIEHRLNNEVVTLDVDGWVVTPSKWEGLIQILVRNGTQTTALSEMVDAFDYLDENFVGYGIGYVMIRQLAVPRDEFGSVYPFQNYEVPYAAIMQGAVDAFDPRDDSTGYSDNMALLVLAHLRRSMPAGGCGVADELIDFTSFADAADLCEEAVALKLGGTEPRYRGAGLQSYGDAPIETLSALLEGMDAQLYLTREGKYGIRCGFDAPGALETITGAHIRAMSWTPARTGITRYNGAVAVFNSEAHDYQRQTTPALDLALEANEPRLRLELGYPYVPSPTQAQRLQKRRVQLLEAPYRGQLALNAAGLALEATGPALFDEPRCPTGIARVSRRSIAEGFIGAGSDDFGGVTVEVEGKPEDYGVWDEATDELDFPPQPAVGSDDMILAPPEITSTELRARIVNGDTKGPLIQINYTALDDDAVGLQIQETTAGDDEWGPLREYPHATLGFARTGLLDDRETYDVRIRFVGADGGVSAWSTASGIEVIAEEIAPGTPTDLSAVPDTTSVTLSARAPQDDYHERLRFFTGVIDDFSAATAVGTVKGPPGDIRTLTLTSLSDGTYYAWAASRNPSGVQGGETASVSFIIDSGI